MMNRIWCSFITLYTRSWSYMRNQVPSCANYPKCARIRILHVFCKQKCKHNNQSTFDYAELWPELLVFKYSRAKFLNLALLWKQWIQFNVSLVSSWLDINVYICKQTFHVTPSQPKISVKIQINVGNNLFFIANKAQRFNL